MKFEPRVPSERIKMNATLQGFNSQETFKMRRIIKETETVLNTHEFKNLVTQFRYGAWVRVGRWPRRRWVLEQRAGYRFNNGYSPLEIFNQFIRGQETLDQFHDKEIDVNVIIDRNFQDGVLGYTYPDSKFQWIYAWAFRELSDAEIVNNVVHEYVHKMLPGWDHEDELTGWTGEVFYKPGIEVDVRRMTVPYAIGDIAQHIYSQMKKSNLL